MSRGGSSVKENFPKKVFFVDSFRKVIVCGTDHSLQVIYDTAWINVEYDVYSIRYIVRRFSNI